MTTDRDEPHAQNDAVADFFAAARAEVRDGQATDLDWQRIVRQSRQASRRRGRLALLGSAAVAIIAVVAALVWQQHGLSGGVQQGQAIAPSNSATYRSGSTGSPSSVSPSQAVTSVPDSFQTWSVSNAGASTIFALGSQTCGGDVCPVLIRSNNNGNKWNAVHTFTGTDVSAATGKAVALIQPERAITQTRFVNPQVGFVFGGDLWGTTDSGASFTKLSHPGERVLDLEINDNSAVLLSADNCAQGECKGPLYVTRFDPRGGTIARPQGSTVTLSTPISSGRVLVQAGRDFVQLASTSNAPLPPMRLDGTTLVTLKGPSACNGTPLQAMTAATDVKPDVLQLFALCNPVPKPGNKLSYTLVRSNDAGTSWTSVSVWALTLPRLGQTWLAVADEKHLAASAGGPRQTNGVATTGGAGSLMYSTNGGGWFGPATPPPGASLPSTGFDWTASPGGPFFYAIPRDTAGFWETTDFGANWKLVDPRP
ncbi:hypothetical protein [Flexivirga caeni]|uniref:Exo-alpha-sialidase n=1 Tax=Flexivirga caeni TaxID=2294115 RepID=A0A3M9LZG1_9MICO|nr:hypothetical protein [Flexivirga caeni]RNI18367.1 hypothetical protein EFY87_17555 [Flexivirga caeni]